MKLTFENRTCWDDSVIRSLVLTGLRAHGITDRCEVLVRYQRRGALICGRAAVGGRWMELLLPREGDPEMVARKLSSTIDHECLHLRGFMHREFPAHARYCTPDGAPWHPDDCADISRPAAPARRTARRSPMARPVRAVRAKGGMGGPLPGALQKKGMCPADHWTYFFIHQSAPSCRTKGCLLAVQPNTVSVVNELPGPGARRRRSQG